MFQTPTKKHKKEKKKEKEEHEDGQDGASLEEGLSPIAHPLAGKKLAKKLHKTVKRGCRHLFVRLNTTDVVWCSYKTATCKERREGGC